MIPIGHLPIELLSVIFIEAAAAEFKADKTTRTRIYISCVSHHWRTLALSTPALWRSLVLHDYSDALALRECIVRSKKLELDLYLLSPPYEEEDEKLHREPYHWDAEDAKGLLDELSRTRLLHVDADPETSHSLDFSKVSETLQRFILSDTNYEIPQLRLDDFDDRWYKPLALLGRLDTTFPNLQSLEIIDHGVSLADVRLPASIVNLRIINIQPFRRDEDASGILNVLRDLPVLEHLSLTNATTKLDANALEHSNPVPLPRLKIFSFEGPLSTCLAFVKSLELPHSARRNLTLHNREETEEDSARLGNELIVELAKWETRFSSVVADISWGHQWMAWKQPQSIEDLEKLAPLPVIDIAHRIAHNDPRLTSSADLQIHFKGNHQALIFRYELLFAHVKSMAFYFAAYHFFNAPSFFTRLDELEDMSYAFESCRKDDQGLSFFMNLNKWNPPLPRLRALRIRRFAFSKENCDPLLALCRERQKTGKNLDIHLISCYDVSEAHLDKLRAVSSSVTWDRENPHRYR